MRSTIHSMNWNELRNEMPVTQEWAYFDHAAVAPITAPAQLAIHKWADDLVSCGVAHAPRWLDRVEEVRHLVARLLNADTEEIAFVGNTTQGISIIADGFPWREGENVITAAEEYPSNVYPWMNLATKGVETRLVRSQGSRIEVDDIIAQMDDCTRIVSLSMVEFASGYRNDLFTIGEACRERGIFFLVDAIQGLGAIPLDVRDTPIDALSADGHKWMLGPEGAGVFWIRKDKIDHLHPIGVGWNSVKSAWNFSTIDFELKQTASRWEGGTQNFAGITALGASIELLLNVGIDRVYERVVHLTDYLCERANRVGLQVFSDRSEKARSGIVSLIPAEENPKAKVKKCLNEKIVISLRSGRFRISPHCYNTEEEIDRLLAQF